ncbi:hypothetical protein ASF84_27035 [Pseudomonas sp. Leaf127]|uniref:hypothetical protein n=1 Tax=Pseudomonas sp. Leaf127 TaxID=1736267 RepID=UPI0007032BEA|nr:hypothetical protein [Pseudomonas sp. Leaf127]KQQ62494.1 hypothetical protein ASF84_27035 [Pseudomonas sp. Leaf127]
MLPSNSRWLWLYYPVSWMTVCVVLAHIAFFNWALLTPREVSGTLFGGAMGTQLYLIGWGVAMIGLIVAILLRLSGSIFAWMAAGLMPLCIGGWWQLNYPDDANGNLIFSPVQSDITVAMLIGAAILASGLYACTRAKTANKKASLSGLKLFGKIVVATALSGFFVSIPLAVLKQQALPDCAVNKQGQQLTVCLDAGDTPTLVE